MRARFPFPRVRAWRRPRGEDGNIMLALLAIIMASGMAVSLGVMMTAGTQATRHDKDYTAALQWADKGVQEALFQVNNGLVPTAGSQAGDPGYAWTATATADGGYVVTSTGTVGKATREVETRLGIVQRFPVAAFGDTNVQMQGNNGADSYNSGTGAQGTGNGTVSSNGNVNLNGNSTHVDGVVLYNNDATGNTCGGRGCDGTSITTIGSKYDVASDANVQFISDQLAACAAAAPLGDWRASDHGGVLAPRPGAPTVPWCFDTMTFDEDTVVSGSVVVFVRGAVSFDNGVDVNCAGCSATSTPDASKLLIYSAGATDTEGVSIGNHSNIAAGIFAPRASCLGNPSGAQADVFGSLICGQVGRITSGNQGGWSFHYDDKIASIGTGGYRVQRWDEN